MDEELFKLCKQVYEATKFETGEWFEITENLIVTDEDKHIMEQDTGDTPSDFIPRYTSDYLLEKLPRNINETTNELLVSRWASRWRACYMPINLGHFPEQRTEADTPLKALLMLVIALDDAGQLVAAETTA